MEENKNSVVIYDYVYSLNSYDAFNLEKGSRFYYDHDKKLYVFHTEHSDSYSSSNYNSSSTTVRDVYLDVKRVIDGIEKGELGVGEKIGELILKA